MIRKLKLGQYRLYSRKRKGVLILTHEAARATLPSGRKELP
jgi:hypothetical protein